ncbi:jg1820, partial [Pararge aegeria aegeria]
HWHDMMLDELGPTAATNWTTTYTDLPNYYITFYDEANSKYVNTTSNITQVRDPEAVTAQRSELWPLFHYITR